MTDINTAIAAFKGWHVAKPAFDIGSTWLIAPGRNESDFEYSMHGTKTFEEIFSRFCEVKKQSFPDFEHDARLYMALYFELPIHIKQSLLWISKEDFGKCVCLAFCKLKGIEVVG